MSRPKMILVAAVVLAFGAGTVSGLLARKEPPQQSPGRQRISLERELKLTPEQAERVRQIWQPLEQSMRQRGREQEEIRRAARRQRDEAIVALFTPEQKEKYDRIQADYASASAQIEREARSVFRTAVEQTKAVLTEPQRRQYDDLLERWSGDRRERHSKGSGERGPGTRPTSQPSS